MCGGCCDELTSSPSGIKDFCPAAGRATADRFLSGIVTGESTSQVTPPPKVASFNNLRAQVLHATRDNAKGSSRLQNSPKSWLRLPLRPYHSSTSPLPPILRPSLLFPRWWSQGHSLITSCTWSPAQNLQPRSPTCNHISGTFQNAAAVGSLPASLDGWALLLSYFIFSGSSQYLAHRTPSKCLLCKFIKTGASFYLAKKLFLFSCLIKVILSLYRKKNLEQLTPELTPIA